MDSAGQHEIQIRYTQIDRINGKAIFTDYDFQVDDKNYFYPASTVKLPIAALALEKINEIGSLTKDTRFYIEGDSLETTFATEISKVFAVSDNAANNRLMEFLGQDDINDRLTKKGINHARLSHRLGVHDADEITTKPLVIYLNDTTVTVFEGTINTPADSLKIQGTKKGIGFYEDDSLIKKPFDFGLKNYYSIDAQHGVLERLLFPEQFSKDQQFNITEVQRKFLMTAMSTLPRNAGYNEDIYYDGYGKFFIYGDTKSRIPEHIKIYNKIGFAYGTLTDCAYITDSKNNVDFLLTATILVNRNGIFNDDIYEFEEIGIPFLSALGRGLYDYELKRKKQKGKK
ncbi:serine hydrolase [uncultured Kriegella sp.]|uniref:serine hydrolase n=1 Tax=uncultured Kriegella sp. TaxID=1798910 RepID=UPI0030DA8585|tara:strand:- start:31999 stop:33027 length:1029 start_codon:yes stop_codon:yes gene_type:complete